MKGPKVTADDPWGYGRSLEWATSCPPPRHNFTRAAADPLGVARRSTCTTRRSPRWTPPTEDKNLLDQALGEPDLEGGTGGERE